MNMPTGLDRAKGAKFYKLLFGKTALPIVTTLGIWLLYMILMPAIEHGDLPFPLIVVGFALVKTFIIAWTTLKQVSKLMVFCKSIEQLLWVFGLLIVITIISSATDYTCLFLYDHTSFTGVPLHSDSFIYQVYHFIYFSIITFSTVGFGDIAPISMAARLVVILEIFLSFFIIVFAFANIDKIHVDE